MKSNSYNVWCTRFPGQERGDLQRWSEPVDQVLWKTAFSLEVRVVRSDLYQNPVVRHGHVGPRMRGKESKKEGVVRLVLDGSEVLD